MLIKKGFSNNLMRIPIVYFFIILMIVDRPTRLYVYLFTLQR